MSKMCFFFFFFFFQQKVISMARSRVDELFGGMAHSIDNLRPAGSFTCVICGIIGARKRP
jgi:hypothetical protein